MMLSVLSIYEQSRNDLCFLCSNTLSEIKSYPNVCDHLFHYKCLRNYVDTRLERNETICCPICNKIFNQIANKYKKSKEILFQNVILSSDETQCCICFSKYKCPVASTDTCTHTFCFECIKKWCTFKHECPMDRMPIKLLLMSDFPGGHITKKEEPPPIEQDLNGDGDNDEIVNTTCEVCNLGNNDHLLLLCDNCNRGYHIYCLTSPLSDIPEGDWFCEECSNDMSVNIPRGIRGFRRVIDDLQLRIDSSAQNRTNPMNRNRRNRQRQTRESLRSDNDWSDTIERRTVRNRNPTRSRPTPISSSDEGVRRSLRNRRQISDNESGPATSLSIPILRNRRRVIVDSEDDDNETDSTPTVSATHSRDTGYLRSRTANQSSGRDRSSVLTNEESSSHRDDTNLSGRNRQGSLSSEPESEIEPRRRPMKIIESSSSESCSSMASGSDAESVPSAPVKTNKRARGALLNDQDDDCPIPRPVKRPRLIDESSSSECVESTQAQSDFSDDETDDDESEDQEELESDMSRDKEPIALRQRHISSSSSLSTIPCRISGPSAPAPKPKTTKRTPKLEEIYTETSSDEGTDSDYDPYGEISPRKSPVSERIAIRSRASTSTIKRKKSTRSRRTTKTTKSSSKRKSSTTKRKSSKKRKLSTSKRNSTTKRRKSIRTTRSSNNLNTTGSSSTSQNNSELISSTRLSLFGREKQLPVVSDEELNVKRCPNPVKVENRIRVGNTSSSILSEISEAQSNLRTISLSTITRQTDGTLIYKTRSDNIDAVENNEPRRNAPCTSSERPVINTKVSPHTAAPAQLPQARSLSIRPSLPTVSSYQPPTTSLSLNRPSVSAVPSNQQPISINSSIRPAVAIGSSNRSPASNVQPVYPSVPKSEPTSRVAESAQKPKPSAVSVPTVLPSNRDSHITEIKRIIIKSLRKSRDKGDITSEESQSLTDRIAQKITKGDIQRKMPGKSSVKDFSLKYLEFYLRKRK